MTLRRMGFPAALVAVLLLAGAIAFAGWLRPPVSRADPASTMSVSVPAPEQPVGPTFTVSIEVNTDAPDFQGYGYILSYDSAVLNATSVTQLQPAGMTLCALTVIVNTGNPGEATDQGCAAQTTVGPFVGAVGAVEMQCIAPGSSTLHLVTLAEDSSFGSTLYASGGSPIPVTTIDAGIGCGGEPVPATPTSEAGATPTSGPPPPGETPVALPTPLPGPRDQISLASGCNLRSFLPYYPDGVDLAAIAVDIDQGNPRIWLQKSTVEFDLFDIRSPERSTVTSLVQEAGFICVDEPAVWSRPALS